MRCHYCDREADVAAESGGVQVGLCEEHFQARMEELADEDQLGELAARLDLEGQE